MKEEDLIYTAGYLDADGCISIYTRKPTKLNGQRNLVHYPSIQISSINKEMIQYFQDIYGGGITKDISQHKNPLYNWKPSVSYMKEFLLSIQKYLKLKKCQSEIMIEFLKEREFSKHRPLTQDQLKKREGYMQEIHRLNQIRG